MFLICQKSYNPLLICCLSLNFFVLNNLSNGIYLFYTYYFGLFGINYGTIDCLYVDGTIEIFAGSSTRDYIYAGLVCGKNEGTIKYAMVNSDFFADNYIRVPLYPDNPKYKDIYIKYGIICERRTSRVGGVTGFNAGTIIASVTYAEIYSCGDAGGIAGWATGLIKDCYASSGIRYYYDYPNIYNDSIGGIVGATESKVENCTIDGIIFYHRLEAIDSKYVTPCMGTIVGQAKGPNAEVIDCTVKKGEVRTLGLLDYQTIYARGDVVGCYNYDNRLI